MPDLVFDSFFDFFAVFLDRTIYIYLQHAVEPCGRTAGKRSVGPKMAVFRPFPRGKNVLEKKSQKWPKWGIF